MHYLNDFSSEIASEFNVSRQAVHDICGAEQTLEEYEYKLQLVERCRREQQYIREVYSLLKGLPLQLKRNPDINQALIRLDDLIDWQKGV